MKTIVWFVLVLSALSAVGKVILVKPGERVSIECGVNTNSDVLSWQRGADFLISTDKYGQIRRDQSDTATRLEMRQKKLVIKAVKEEDAGQFTCTADGKSQEHTLLVMSVSVRPLSELQQGSVATLHCQVKGLNPDPQVQWRHPNGGKTIESPTFNLKSVVLSDAGTWLCTFSHAGETYSKELDIKVQVVASTTSPSQTSKNISVPASTSSNALGPLGLSWWIWVAVGVGSLVVVFLTVLVIVLYKRIKRRKKRLLKIRNAGQQLKPRQYCQCDQPTAAAKPQQGRRREKPY